MYVLNLIIYYGVILPLSYLPLRVLYIFSDGLYLLMYYIAGYRKKVVTENIYKSFPEKSEAEKRAIIREFYRHFCDILVESLKCFTISRKEASERMKAEDMTEINKTFADGKSAILAGGHLNNWELFAIAADMYIPHQAIAIYSPLKNRFFDKKMRLTRGKYGLKLIPMKQIGIYLNHHREQLTATIFAMDQSPSNPHKSYWMEFLNQDTSVFLGAERYAVKFNMPVYYGRIYKIKRGYYSFNLIRICDDPSKTSPGEITAAITKKLEEDIRIQPAYWLWSHRRWKRSKPTGYTFSPVRG